jgi:2-iminobutanoate/2-iminopropanoate deaminase
MPPIVETSTPSGTPTPIGPYNHIAKAGNFITVSGTAGVDPATGEMAGPDAYSQARQILKTFAQLLESVGSDLQHVLHIQVFLKDVGDFADMNRAYEEGMGNHRPARTVIGVADLPKAGARLTMNLNAVTRD